jgi:RNA polymerase II elongation factor ELL
LNSILNSVSNVRDNVYELSKTGWTEVKPDWDDYTSEEKESVKSRHSLSTQQTLEPTTNSTAPNEISPLSDCGSMPIFSSPMSMDSPIGSKSPAISKRSAESCSSVAKKHKPLVSSQTEISTNNDKSPNIKLKTNGYNHLLNGWANKPSSPERDPILINANINTNGDLKTIDSTLSNPSQPSPDSNPMYLSQQQFHNQTNRVISYLPNDNTFSKSQSRNAFNRFKTNGYHMTNGNGSDSINSSPNSSPDSGTGSHDGSTLSSSNSYTLCTNDETPDYLSKYTKIVNNEQRAQYKRDFYIEYEEYRRLYRYIDNVAAKFTELEIRLNTKAEGSDEWNVSSKQMISLIDLKNVLTFDNFSKQKLMDQIVKEYEDTKNSPKFQKCRKRMFYLHEKLAHIKSLVLEYDRNYHKEKNRLSHKLQLKSNPMS